jgi:hypothetical protein
MPVVFSAVMNKAGKFLVRRLATNKKTCGQEAAAYQDYFIG